MPGDIGIGLILAWLFSLLTNQELSWQMIVVGVAGSLFPDLDAGLQAVKRIIKRQRITDAASHEHRFSPLHWPLTITLILLALLPVFILTIGWQYWLLFTGGTILHIIHDVFLYGWGVQLLWPRSKKLLCYRQIGIGKQQWHWLTPEQVEEYSSPDRHGDPNWLTNIYLYWYKFPLGSDYFTAGAIEYATLAAGIALVITSI